MLLNRKIIEKFVQSARIYCTTVKSIPETLLIQKTTYKTDDWTNINRRFEPFVGANLYQKPNHPLRLTQEEVVKFFKKWFSENINCNTELPVYKNLDPIEPNTLLEEVPNAFYVNKDLMLRTHAINREIKYLQSGVDNFMMIVDLYRRCEMDNQHFPAFHRINIIRTMDCEKLLRRSERKEVQQAKTAQRLRDEQQAAMIEMAKYLLGTEVKYRWSDTNLASTEEPSWMFEIWHAENWHRISAGGLIKNDIFERSQRIHTAGWEISIGLDRLAMALYNIFDMRLLWNSDPKFLNKFKPQILSEKLQAKLAEEGGTSRSVLQIPTTTTQSQSSVVNNNKKKKKAQFEKHISFILPPNVDLETFPSDDLCKFILQNTENAAKEVRFSWCVVFKRCDSAN